MTPAVPPSECVRARESISAQLDGELSELDSARLVGHLRSCSGCEAHARELAAIAGRLRAAPLAKPELEIWLPQRRRTAALRTAPLRMSAAAAALVVAAGLSFVVGHHAAGGGGAGSAGLPTAHAAGPQTGFAAGDLLQTHVLAVLRQAHLRDTRPAGRLIFV